MTDRIAITYTHAPFANGWRIGVTDTAGDLQVGIDKQYNALRASFAAGSPVLVDAEGRHVCGPVDLEGARALAREILSGGPRSITEPQAILSLALAYFFVMDMLDFADATDLVVGAPEGAEVSHG